MKQSFKNHKDIWQERNEKSKKTNLERYGVENVYLINSTAIKSRHTHRLESFKSFDNFKDKVIPLFTKEEYLDADRKSLKWKCLKCGEEFVQEYRKTRISSEYYNMPRCPNCYPKHYNLFQKDVFTFCQTFFKNILENDRKLIYPYEVDILIPEINLAIECNGIYWHSTSHFQYKFGNLLKFYRKAFEKNEKM